MERIAAKFLEVRHEGIAAEQAGQGIHGTDGILSCR